MKTFFGEGRINGNSGTFVAKAYEMDTARDNISRGVAMKAMVHKPNLMLKANPKMEELLDEAIEKGDGGMKGYRTYKLDMNTWFLEFWDPFTAEALATEDKDE